MENNNFIQRINNSFAKFAEWVLNHRLLVIIGCVLLSILCVHLATKLHFNLSPLAFAPEVETRYYKDFMKDYGNDEFIYIQYGAKQGIFDLEILRKTNRLVEDLKKVPYVRKVNSITNVEIIEGTTSGEIKAYGIMDVFPVDQSDADSLMKKIIDKPLYVDSYISRDGKYAAILCELNQPNDDPVYQSLIMEKLREVLKKPGYKDFKFRPVGNPVLVAIAYEIIFEDLAFLTSAVFILLGILLIILFKQGKGFVGPLVVIKFAILFAVGFIGMAEFPITSTFTSLPAILGAIGVADAVHIISEYQYHLKSGYNNRASIIKSAEMLGFPCLFTSLTTAAGFASLVISPMWGIRHYGIYIAFGVLAAFGISFTILLLILDISGKKSERKFNGQKLKEDNGIFNKTLRGIACINSKSPTAVLTFTAVLLLMSIYGISKVEINASVLRQLGDKIEMVKDYKFVDETMGGTGNFEILLNSNKSEGIKSIQFIQIMEKIQRYAETKDYIVNKTVSVVDMIKEVNRALHANDRQYYTIPSSEGNDLQDINEFIYELNGGEELETFVSANRDTARLTIFVKSGDSKTAKVFYEDITAYVDSIKPAEYTYSITGASFLNIRIIDSVAQTLVQSLMLAIAIISLMMIIVFRSFKIGLLSMFPNIFPIIITLGFMGVTGIWLDHQTVLFGCIIIGIVVDDTIHFISRFKMEFDRLGNYNMALEASLTSVGRALSITTIILMLGFSVCMLSRMDLYFYFGLICSACFPFALYADFFLAPALILRFKPFGEEFEVPQENDNIEESIYLSGEESAVVT